MPATDPETGETVPIAHAAMSASPIRAAADAAATRSDEVAVEAHDLDIGHPGDVVVSGIDLVVRARSSLALVGTNGSGKSTLIRTIVGLLPPVAWLAHGLRRGAGPQPDAGRVRRPVPRRGACAAHPRHRRRAHGPLRAARPPGTHGRRPTTTSSAGRWSRWASPTSVAPPLRTLSGGQRQRVYLAQALARRADLIVLDEPTAGLDAGGRERYLEAFAGELHRGAAIITATHDIGEATEYDQVLLLARRVVALGSGDAVLTPDRLLETFGVVIHDAHEEHAGRFTVAERAHGSPQTIETRRPEA